MADITVRIEKTGGTISIEGEATQAGHEGELEAIAIRDLVEAPTGTSKAQLSEIFLTRYRDKASPKLAEACSMGENLGTVTVSLFKNTETGPQIFMKYTLTDTFVSRIEHETAEANGGAFLPHRGYSNYAGHAFRALWNLAGMTQNADRGYSRARANPVPVYPPARRLDHDRRGRAGLAQRRDDHVDLHAVYRGRGRRLDREGLGFADQRLSLARGFEAV